MSSVLTVKWARHHDELRAAQRLRWQVFAQEMGARLTVPPGTPAGHDADPFDDVCEHLLVETAESHDAASQVVGTYRVLMPSAAHRLGHLYIENEFEIGRLAPLRSELAELGRSCTHPQWRHGAVILMLWGSLAKHMQDHGLRHMIGCVSIPLTPPMAGIRGLCHRLLSEHGTDPQWRVTPHRPLPMPQGALLLDRPPPPLVKGYIACGARVLGAPAVDPEFGCADLPMWLRLDDIPQAYRRRFLKSLPEVAQPISEPA